MLRYMYVTAFDRDIYEIAVNPSMHKNFFIDQNKEIISIRAA